MMRKAPGVLAVLVGFWFALGCGGGSNTPSTAQMRVTNSIADSASGGYDVVLDGSTLATGLAYRAATSYTSVSSGSHTVEYRNAGTTADIINQSVSLNGGTSYTFVAAGPGTGAGGILLSDTTTAASSGNVQIRVVNATGVFGPMDVYINPPGTNIFSVSADFSNLGLGGSSSYKTFAAATYDVRITKPGDKSIIYFDSGGIVLSSGAVITVIITGPGANPGGLPLSFQQLTDATS